MTQLKSMFRFYILLALTLTLNSSVLFANNPQSSLQAFVEARKSLVALIQRPNVRNESVNWNIILERLKAVQISYSQINRQKLTPYDLYNAQTQLRITNTLIKKYLDHEYKENRLSKVQRQDILYQAHFYDKNTPINYLSPQKAPSSEGQNGPSLSITELESETEYYNYNFKNDSVLFRGLEFRSGDVLFNYTTQRPEGIFTAVGENQSVFPHLSVVIFLKTLRGKLPLVLDIYTYGARLIPLHHFLSKKHVLFTEVFRFKNPPTDWVKKLDDATRLIISEPRRYDLLGDRTERKALGCTELLDFLFELMNLPSITLKDKIKSTIYKNILKFGYFPQTFLMPNDILFDGRFKFVGYLDNNPNLSDIIVNDLVVNQFRRFLETKSVKNNPGTFLKLTVTAINKMKNTDTIFGKFLLFSNKFNEDNFPVGDPGLIGAVGVVTLSLGTALNSCTNYYQQSNPSPCNIYLEELLVPPLTEDQFSIQWWRNEKKLRTLIESETSIFNNLFK